MNLSKKKKEETWLSPIAKDPTPTEKSKKQHDNIKNATKNFDYTTIADRLRTVSWSNPTVTPLVWLNRFTSAQPSHSLQQQCNQTNTARQKYYLQYTQTFT